MKRKGYLIEKIADYDNLCIAFRKACKGKHRKQEVLRFREDFDNNIALLRQQILAAEVDVGHYSYFTIRDPKERVICAAELNERILHHAILNICHEYFDKSLIDTTYATRRKKGVYAAIDKAVEACTKYKYTVKLDFRKYYDNIDHEVLKSLLRRKFKDGRLLLIFDSIIDSYNTSEGKGLPIGNLTSQYFANAFLSPLDHYAKERLNAPIYIRYMDDIMLACNDKNQLKGIVHEITAYARERLMQTLKPPIYNQSKDGQVFLGYKILPHRYELSGRSKRRFRTKMAMYDRHLATGKWDADYYKDHVLPLTAFACHAVSHKFRCSCIRAI